MHRLISALVALALIIGGVAGVPGAAAADAGLPAMVGTPMDMADCPACAPGAAMMMVGCAYTCAMPAVLGAMTVNQRQTSVLFGPWADERGTGWLPSLDPHPPKLSMHG